MNLRNVINSFSKTQQTPPKSGSCINNYKLIVNICNCQILKFHECHRFRCGGNNGRTNNTWWRPHNWRFVWGIHRILWILVWLNIRTNCRRAVIWVTLKLILRHLRCITNAFYFHCNSPRHCHITFSMMMMMMVIIIIIIIIITISMHTTLLLFTIIGRIS